MENNLVNLIAERNKKLEKIWTNDTNRLRYTYNWSLDDDNKPIISFLSEKIQTHSQVFLFLALTM